MTHADTSATESSLDVNRTSGPSRRWSGLVADLGMVVFGGIIVGLYSSWNRPIWVDEYLHFAFGPMSLGEVLSAIHGSSTEINHGQTGAYMLTDWALLQIFGANAVALRLPSLLAGALLLFSAVMVLRLRGFARGWQYLMIGFLGCQAFLMYFVGEARPYIVLAATSVAALAYYLIPLERRRSFLGWSLAVLGMWWGALNHPYFPLMLGVVLVVALVAACQAGWLRGGFSGLVRFVDPWILGASAVLYVGVGAATWLRGTPDFGYDPFANLGSQEEATSAFWRDHLGVLQGRFWLVALIIALVVLALLLGRFRGASRLAAPALLIVLAIGTSFAVSAASYLTDYWILERQWVAGIALLAVGVVWLVAQVFSSALGLVRWVAVLPGLVLAVVVLQGLWGVWQAQTEQLRAYAEQQKAIETETRSVEEMVADGVDWPYVANVNIARGGPVWPIFEEWYGRQAGIREE